MQKSRLKKYAKLIVKCGLNVKKGQLVFIDCGLDQPDFVAMVVEECYKAGAKRVKVNWSYMPVTKLNYNYRSLATLSEVTDVEKAELQEKVDTLACKLWLESRRPRRLERHRQRKDSKGGYGALPDY